MHIRCERHALHARTSEKRAQLLYEVLCIIIIVACDIYVVACDMRKKGNLLHVHTAAQTYIISRTNDSREGREKR